MTKLTARKLTMGLVLAATAIAGTAYAQQDGRLRPDGDRNATVTRAEAQAQAAAMFTRMDVNKDGKIDKADRDARRETRRNAMFDRLDSDKNGQISRAEFGSRPDRAPRADAAKPGAEAGKHRGDGERGWGKRGGKRGWGHGGGMMMGRMADADKDGAVTQAEFTAAALQRFDRSDANKDGQVTSEERRAAHQAMREEWRAKREAAKAATPAN